MHKQQRNEIHTKPMSIAAKQLSVLVFSRRNEMYHYEFVDRQTLHWELSSKLTKIHM